MTRWHGRVAPIMVALTTAALVAACGAGGRPDDGGGAAATGITEDTVRIGGHFPLTGVAAPGYSEIPSGHKAYYDYVNANGGVHGRTIEFIVRDDAYNPTNTSQVTNELVLSDQIFAMVGGLGTPTHSAVVDFLNGERVPDLLVSSGSLQWGDAPGAKPFTFGWQPDYEIEGKIIGRWVRENLPDARVGLFLQDDDFGRDGEQGVRRYLDDQIVEVTRYTSGNTDVAPQIAALQAAGVDLVLGFNTPSYTALTQLASLKTNFEPRWFYSNVGSDPALVGSLLARFSEGAVRDGASLLDDVLTTEYIPGVDAPDDPWMRLWRQVWDTHGAEGELTNYRVFGMSQAYTFVQALQAAGPNPTREGIVEALEKVGGGFSGPALAPFRYSADSHLGISGMQVIELHGGVGQELTPVLVTDIGDAPIREDDSAADDAPPGDGIPDVPPAVG
ncbi:ABC-type branched-chain amino acid transport system, substrate-binding protein [Amycolatopsis arida]|uniref:ABC-type branched-chain amino acid transport system, substrate-binding protein n=1 Tax=Amycolatopsis arida TaxID=587909 RepID=A0A1I5MCD9_9PSEU|nr:ABC transporter substrate-binding protein [Amycolatopsis arida]TDX94047.1 ABC-type branched-subunit amino acid transport system substrate-binding protein [Amycolatopsis arida]SFP07254.1 ABC-type branched-chain amino acid transport system, substrate-binding protein [Amycolatopsis arida]